MPFAIRRAHLCLAAAVLAATVAVLLALAAPSEAASGCTSATSSRGCLEVTDSVDPVAPSGHAGTPTYLTLTQTASNQGGNTLTHGATTTVLPAGSTFRSVTVKRGNAQCSHASGTLSCSLGQMPPGTVVVVEILVQTPSQEGLVSTRSTLSFAERGNDNPNNTGKTDTVTVSETTEVDGDAGKTFVPANTPVSVATESTETTAGNNPQYGRATIPASPSSFIASITEVLSGGPAFNCVFGRILLDDGLLHHCRRGNWILAEIPGTFSPYLEFNLLSDKSLDFELQNKDNFEVFYAATASSTPRALPKCGAIVPAGGCTAQVIDEGTRWRAIVRKPTNGYMR